MDFIKYIKLKTYNIHFVSQVVPGADVAGVVAEVGQGVSKFKKGDVVYGNILKITEGKPRQVGTLAEYTVAE